MLISRPETGRLATAPALCTATCLVWDRGLVPKILTRRPGAGAVPGQRVNVDPALRQRWDEVPRLPQADTVREVKNQHRGNLKDGRSEQDSDSPGECLCAS